MSADVFAEHYAAAVPIARERMGQIESLVAGLVPDGVPKIAYGIPTITVRGRNVVHWAGFDRHVGFYPGAATIAAFADQFDGRKYAKGSVQFAHDAPLPLDLIERMVRFRLGQPDLAGAGGR